MPEKKVYTELVNIAGTIFEITLFEKSAGEYTLNIFLKEQVIKEISCHAAENMKQFDPALIQINDNNPESCIQYAKQFIQSTPIAAANSEYYKKTLEANKLLNDESNRIITWCLSIIGGSIATIISTGYVNPTGYILYTYGLFAVGWAYLGFSIYYGEKITRIYIAQVTASQADSETIAKIGEELDDAFRKQLGSFKCGIFTFSVWLILFLTWYIVIKT